MRPQFQIHFRHLRTFLRSKLLIRLVISAVFVIAIVVLAFFIPKLRKRLAVSEFVAISEIAIANSVSILTFVAIFEIEIEEIWLASSAIHASQSSNYII